MPEPQSLRESCGGPMEGGLNNVGTWEAAERRREAYLCVPLIKTVPDMGPRATAT